MILKKSIVDLVICNIVYVFMNNVIRVINNRKFLSIISITSIVIALLSFGISLRYAQKYTELKLSIQNGEYSAKDIIIKNDNVDLVKQNEVDKSLGDNIKIEITKSEDEIDKIINEKIEKKSQPISSNVKSDSKNIKASQKKVIQEKKSEKIVDKKVIKAKEKIIEIKTIKSDNKKTEKFDKIVVMKANDSNKVGKNANSSINLNSFVKNVNVVKSSLKDEKQYVVKLETFGAQIGSFEFESMAQVQCNHFNKEYKAKFKDLQCIVTSSQVNDKTVFRSRIHSFTSRQNAIDFCIKVSSNSNFSKCFVVIVK